MAVILVTGALGFVGSTVVLALQEVAASKNYTIWASDVRADADPHRVPTGVQYVQLDVRHGEQAKDVLARVRPTVVVHTAGVVPNGFPRYETNGPPGLFELNVGGTQTMLAAARACGTVTAFVFTGSCTCITDDLDHNYPNVNETMPYPKRSLPYGRSKALAEPHVLAANAPGFATCTLRPSTIMGREDYQLVPAIHACIDKFETPWIIGTDDNLYDFTFVDNVAHAHVLAVDNLLTTQTAAGEAIFISNNQPVTFRDFMKAIWGQFGHKPPFEMRIPTPLAWFVGLSAEVYHKAFVRSGKATLSRGSVRDAMQTAYSNQTKAQQLLGYWPVVDIWDGVRISCDALKMRLAAQNAQKRG